MKKSSIMKRMWSATIFQKNVSKGVKTGLEDRLQQMSEKQKQPGPC